MLTGRHDGNSATMEFIVEDKQNFIKWLVVWVKCVKHYAWRCFLAEFWRAKTLIGENNSTYSVYLQSFKQTVFLADYVRSPKLWHRPTIVLSLSYCHADDTGTSKSAQTSAVSGVSSRYCRYRNHAGTKPIWNFFIIIIVNWDLNKVCLYQK